MVLEPCVFEDYLNFNLINLVLKLPVSNKISMFEVYFDTILMDDLSLIKRKRTIIFSLVS